MILDMTDKQTLAKVVEAIKTVETSPWGSKEFGDARSFLVGVLEKDLREWVKAHPPGTADYDAGTPRRAVYLYSDELHPDFAGNTVMDILLNQGSYFEKVVVKVLQSGKSSARKSEKDVVAARFPEYGELCKEIRDVKKRWNAEDAAIKRSDSFRMMGGLARLGSRAGSEYGRLVEKAQAMEKSALGKILTKHARAGR